MRIKEDIKVLKNWTMNMNQIKCVYTGGPLGVTGPMVVIAYGLKSHGS